MKNPAERDFLFIFSYQKGTTMTENIQLMRSARKSLDPYWVLAVLVSLVYMLITGWIGAIQNTEVVLGNLLGILITAPIALGFSIFAINISRDNDPQFSNLFQGFNRYGTIVLAYFIMILLIVIGFILLIVPGIIVALGFSMTLYIIADDPEISATDALQKSWKMMNGYKWTYFRLLLRFIPWIFLGFILLLVGLLFVVPWLQVSTAKFYDEIKDLTPSLMN